MASFGVWALLEAKVYGLTAELTLQTFHTHSAGELIQQELTKEEAQPQYKKKKIVFIITNQVLSLQPRQSQGT